ncbi:MAG: winged helix-turn-helix transcriptional regulator [Actinomycetota bacterium]
MGATSGASGTSALEAALERVGDRWSLLLVEALLHGPRRWSDLAGEVSGIAPNVLADRLRRLERAGVVAGEPYSERPLRLTYGLTSAGRELAGAVRLLTDWGAGRAGGGEAPRHRTCGTPMEARWHCPTCDLTVEERGTEPGEPGEIVNV